MVQRVSEARVSVAGEIVATMGEGLLALVGVAQGDTHADAAWVARKLVHLRLFENAAGRMDRSLLEVGGALGVVSQFTLLGDARRGRRPSWAAAAPPAAAQELVEAVAQCAREAGAPVVSGRFRAAMDVALVNRGPVTLLLDSRQDAPASGPASKGHP